MGRSARLHTLRWWGTGALAVAVAIVLPKAILAMYHRDESLRATGTHRSVEVIETNLHPRGKGATPSITVGVDARKVKIFPEGTKPAVGDSVEVVVGAGEKGRVLLAYTERTEAEAKVGAVLVPVAAVGLLVFFGLGPGARPYSAVRAMRSVARRRRRTPGRVVAVAAGKASRGVVFELWRTFDRNQYRSVDIETGDGDVVRWCGPGAIGLRPGSEVVLGGGSEVGTWALLEVVNPHGRCNSTYWPAERLSAAEPAPDVSKIAANSVGALR